MTIWTIGDKVWVRGRFASAFSLRGVVELVDSDRWDSYGVRAENGNFYWCSPHQLKRFADGPG